MSISLVPQTRLPSAAILLVLRRMRVPIIVLITVFAVSAAGLTLIPGQDAQGQPHRLSIFEAFYFMTYTASTIGFGELPNAFTPAQRMWVTVTIFLSVVGWAYAVGALLSLMQDRSFRRAVAHRHFANKVRRMAEPFLVIVGYGNAARRLARSLDEMGRRFVVVDRDEDRAVRVELDSYHADTPALVGDARDTGVLALAGIGHARCEGVVALTGDDETNLDVTMTTGLLRSGLPVIARTSSRDVAERMRLFGAWQVVNPLDRFGDHLRILLRSPAAYQLMLWLTSGPGTPLPSRRDPLPRGRWVVCGGGRFSDELTADLRAEGVDVTVVDALEPEAGLDGAVAFVAATEDDMTNLWLLERARRVDDRLFLVVLQNRAGNAPLFKAAEVDFGMLPAELIVHEVLARLANPELMRFLPQVPHMGDAWAEEMTDRLTRCGTGAPDLWSLPLTAGEAPALLPWLEQGTLRLGDLLRDPRGRDESLDVVPLALLRGEDTMVAPEGDVGLRLGDVLLVAAGSSQRRIIDATLSHPPTAAYVMEGRRVPSTWIWRWLARDRADDRRG